MTAAANDGEGSPTAAQAPLEGRQVIDAPTPTIDRLTGGGTLVAGHPGDLGPPRLSMERITKHFGGTLALDHVDIKVQAGEIHGLVGQNGAGKSTLMKILAGDYRADAGKILVDGCEVAIRDPRQGLSLGIGIVYQELSLLPNLTVAENIALGREPVRRGVIVGRRVASLAEAALVLLGVQHIRVETPVRRLSVAEQQLIEIAKVLSARAKILVLDEPTASLTLEDSRRLFNALRHLRDTGVSIIFVSHRYREVLELCDRCTVLRNGRVVATEDAATVDLQRLVDLTLGDSRPRERSDILKGRPGKDPLPVVLDVHNLSVGTSVLDVSFQVRKGEIVGLCGLLGSGQTNVARALFGDIAISGGTIAVAGRRVHPSGPRAATRLGVGFISENRRDEGLFPDMTVIGNVTVASLRKTWYSRWIPLLSPKRERELTRSVLGGFGMADSVQHKYIKLLSGGNQQKAMVVRWLVRGSPILVCSEPTRGVDVGARFDIYERLRALAAQGTCIVVVTTEIDEALTLCDRVVVLYEGRVSAELECATTTEESLFFAMQGLDSRGPTSGR